MIAKLKGIINEIKPTELVLDVNGVGYQLSIPFTTYEKIHNHNMDEILLHVYTLHREDQFRLFGFFTVEEKTLFSILLSISGIGPIMALSILSGIDTDMLIQAVRSDNAALLTKIPGVGKNKAEKLVFELKRRMKKLEDSSLTAPSKPSLRNDAIEALVSLGFEESKSTKVVEAILKETPEIPIEMVIKTALQNLST
ncbi:MAG: Holliday junction branch migration protein RuvA [Spirochaetota bacterium]|nr:Holliday junction branch migration protein RuvA [Spirochaetota bacterium]